MGWMGGAAEAPVSRPSSIVMGKVDGTCADASAGVGCLGENATASCLRARVSIVGAIGTVMEDIGRR